MRKYLKNNRIYEDYCSEHGIDSDKLLKSPASYNKTMIVFQNPKMNNHINGIKDETPAKIIMRITKNNDGLSFEPSEDILDYVGI